MKPERAIVCNIHNYENMSVEEINALIHGLYGLRKDKLTKKADEHTKKLKNLICDIMDNGFVVYFGDAPIEPSDLEVRTY